MNAEGWFCDPYKIHEARWFSDGTPTSLVRDGHDEAKDPPPDGPYSGELQELVSSEAADGDDLRRVDGPAVGQSQFMTALDQITASFPPM